jgi:hypothetical protein
VCSPLGSPSQDKTTFMTFTKNQKSVQPINFPHIDGI